MGKKASGLFFWQFRNYIRSRYLASGIAFRAPDNRAVPRCLAIHAFLPGIALHIVQRGHDRQPVFVNASDYRYYLQNLMEVKAERSIRLLSYFLMANHGKRPLSDGRRLELCFNLNERA